MGVGMIPIELDMCIMDSQATGIEVYVLSVKFLKKTPGHLYQAAEWVRRY